MKTAVNSTFSGATKTFVQYLLLLMLYSKRSVAACKQVGSRPTEVNKRVSSDARLAVEWRQEGREAGYVVSITNYQELSTTLARQEPEAPSAKIFQDNLHLLRFSQDTSSADTSRRVEQSLKHLTLLSIGTVLPPSRHCWD